MTPYQDKAKGLSNWRYEIFRCCDTIINDIYVWREIKRANNFIWPRCRIVDCETKLRIHFQISMMQPSKIGNEQVITCYIYWSCDYLSILIIRLIRSSKGHPGNACYVSEISFSDHGSAPVWCQAIQCINTDLSPCYLGYCQDMKLETKRKIHLWKKLPAKSQSYAHQPLALFPI